MTIYILQCVTEEGRMETNGYFCYIENAKIKKAELDNYKSNKRYNIRQSILEVETEDELF